MTNYANNFPNPEALDAATWERLFQSTQIPLYIEDVTAVRGLVQQAWEASTPEMFRSWLDAHPEFVGQFIAKVKIVDANAAAVALTAASCKEDLFISLERTVLPETLNAFKDLICVIAAGSRYYEGECRYRTLDGREIQTFNQGWIPAVDADCQLMVLATIDITDLTLAKQALAESEERYRLLIETARDVIIRHNLNGQITFVNQAGIDMLGVPREQIIGLNSVDLLSPKGQLEALKRRDYREAGNASVMLYETEFIRPNGGAIPLEVSSTLLPGPLNSGGEPQVLLVARDISQRRQTQKDEMLLETRLRDAQKLESLGVLAGGIAHDFNNLLVTILGNAELLAEDIPDGDEQKRSLGAITEAGEQAAELCRQMQAYAGSAPTEVKAQSLTTVVEEIQHLVQVSLAGGSQMHYELAPELSPVLIDPAQVRQVIIGMVTNAAESIAPGGGEVMIRTGEKNLTTADLNLWSAGAELQVGQHIYCEVRDSGCGMDTATVSRMFEPFYSTKFAGRGLGMAAALGIIKSHGGAFTVDSQLDRGTVVTFWLPVHVLPVKNTNGKPEADTSVSFDLKGRTILLVDDNARVRAVAESFLRRLGCRVLSAADGFEAVRIFGQRHDEIEAIILDYTMPGLDGGETSRRLRVIQPAVPLLISSGHDEAAVRAMSGDLSMAGFVAKPYRLRQLNVALAMALNN